MGFGVRPLACSRLFVPSRLRHARKGAVGGGDGIRTRDILLGKQRMLATRPLRGQGARARQAFARGMPEMRCATHTSHAVRRGRILASVGAARQALVDGRDQVAVVGVPGQLPEHDATEVVVAHVVRLVFERLRVLVAPERRAVEQPRDPGLAVPVAREATARSASPGRGSPRRRLPACRLQGRWPAGRARRSRPAPPSSRVRRTAHP